MAKYEPTDTITWESDQVILSQQATAALLEFASDDEMRPHLNSVGIRDGQLCATDAHTLLRYDEPQCEPVRAKNYDGKYWSRAYVDMAYKVAKLEKRDVVLKFDGMIANGNFPPVNQVVPEPGFGTLVRGAPKDKGIRKMPTAIGFNPDYFARLSKVCKAVAPYHNHTCGAALVAAGSELDPVMFTVANVGSPLKATVVIMPMRI